MKKGFTTIELLVSIALMLLIAGIAIPIVINSREETLEKNYETRINTIINGAILYGNESINSLSSDCKNVTVGFLIQNGYVVGDDKNKTVLKDPRDSSSMNDIIVCVTYEANSKGVKSVKAKIN